MTDTTPTAAVLTSTATTVTILCPYCSHEHTHKREHGRKGRFHHVPACGLERSPDQRMAGYIFTIPSGKAA
jgi:hypothetical protein